MFKLTKRDKRTKREIEIDNLISLMARTNPATDEYKSMANSLDILIKARDSERARRVSPDTLAIVAANLLGIVLVLNYEHTHVITSKAFNWILKGRV